MSAGIARKSVETFLVRVTIQAIAVLGGIIIARELGASPKGLFTYVATVVGTIQMLWAGQSSAIVWQYAKRGYDAAAVFRASMRIYVVGAGAGTAILLGIAAAFPQQRILYAAAAVLPFALFAQSSTGFFLADSDVRTLNVQQAISAAAPVLVFIPLLLFAHAGLSAVLISWAAAWVAAAAFSLSGVLARTRGHAVGDERGLVRMQLAYGSQMSLNSVVSYLNFRIDVFLVLFMLGQQALGIYSVGVGLGELLFYITRPIVTAAMGQIAHGTERESAGVTATCMRHSFALVLVCSVAVYFAGPPLVVLVYGAKFAAAGAVLRYLLPGVIAYSTMPVLAAFYSQQLGNPRIPLYLSSASMVLCAGITAALLNRVGIVGGAIATSASYLTAFVFSTWYFIARTGVPLQRLFILCADDLQTYRRIAHVALAWPVALAARLNGR